MEPIIGSMMIFAGNFPPRGWAFCDGALLPIRANTALFSILGTNYGGDGINTFALPDLRDRSAVGIGQGPGLTNRVLGESYGTESNKMLLTNMPMHTHGVTGTVGIGANSEIAQQAETPVGNYLCASADSIYATSTNGAMGNSIVKPDAATGATGSGMPFSNFQPSLALNYCIALAGIYPQRP